MLTEDKINRKKKKNISTHYQIILGSHRERLKPFYHVKRRENCERIKHGINFFIVLKIF